MSQPTKQLQTQLQELESTIRQRRQYLQAQDNQIQRNLDLLTQQKQALKQNKASLAKQQAKLDSLTKDQAKALEILKKKAEKEPSDRYVRLLNDCGVLKADISKLTRQKANIEESIADSSEALEKLDMDIIEADAIHKELELQIKTARQKLKRSEESASFQASVSAQLTVDIERMDKQLEKAEKFRVALEKDQEAINKQVDKKNLEFKNLSIQIDDKKAELKTLNQLIANTTKSLKQLSEKDKNFRRNLAEEKQKLERDKENIRSSKQALKRELEIRKQVDPKFKLNPTDEPTHFKL